MTGILNGLVGSLKSAGGGPPPPTLRRCTSFQISIACCTSTSSCGELGAGVTCTTASGSFDANAC